MRWPTAVDPVNDTMSMSRLALSAAAGAGSTDVTRFTTPGGKPTSCSTSASAQMASGSCGAGFITTVQPTASAGAIFRVPLLAWDERPGRQVALDASGAMALMDVDLTAPVTIVLGAERAGLPDELLDACDTVAAIPMPGDAESLNVAAAGAIALYELSRRSV